MKKIKLYFPKVKHTACEWVEKSCPSYEFKGIDYVVDCLDCPYNYKKYKKEISFEKFKKLFYKLLKKDKYVEGKNE